MFSETRVGVNWVVGLTDDMMVLTFEISTDVCTELSGFFQFFINQLVLIAIDL